MIDVPSTSPTTGHRRRWLLIGTGVALVLVVLAFTVKARASTSATDELRTATATRADVTQTLDQVATVEPVVQASVAFPVAGTVASVDVGVGDTVSAGTTLAALDTTALETAVHEKQASLDDAELALQQAENGESTNSSGTGQMQNQNGSMSSSGAPSSNGDNATAATSTTTISSEQLSSYRSAVSAAEADLAAAQQDLAQATITSPIDGTVIAVSIGPGASVSAKSTTETIVIAGAGGYELTTKVAVVHLPDVKVGQPVTITPDGTSTTLTGHVANVAVAPDTTTTSTGSSTYTVIFAVDGDTSSLRNGATASVRIVTKQVSDVIAVPTSSVHVDGTRRTITVVDGDTTREATVETGAVGAELTEITSGIQEGDVVVLADLGQPLPSSATESTSSRTGTNGRNGTTGGSGGFTPPSGGFTGSPPSGGGFPR